MAAIFATPVAATLLAVELLLFEWKPRSFIPVAISTTVAAALRVPVLGPGPIFPVIPHSVVPRQSLIVAAVIGVLAPLLIIGGHWARWKRTSSRWVMLVYGR